MYTYSNTRSSVVLSLLAVLVVGGLITNGFALMAQKVQTESC
jgi:hypothetical protein